jgi:hypothetical protein
MKIGADLFCNCCGAEIPAGENANEFETGLLNKTGHCHDECTAQRNAIVRRYDETVLALGALLDPSVRSAPKTYQQILVETNRGGGPLKRVPSKARTVRIPQPAGLSKRPRSTKGAKVVHVPARTFRRGA